MSELRYLLQQVYERSLAPPMLAPDPAAMQRLLEQCHRRRYPGKTAILRPGDPANTLFYVIDGSVNGLGVLAQEVGVAVRAPQTGRIRGYVTLLLASVAIATAAAVLAVLLLR